MEKFFEPIRRLQKRWRGDDPFDYAEVQLTIPVEDFLFYRWDWEDLCEFASGAGSVLRKIIWIEDNTCFAFGDLDDLPESFHNYTRCPLFARTMATSCCYWEPMLTIFQNDDSALSTGACSVFWRALRTSNKVKLCIENNEGHLSRGPGNLSSGPDLSQFLRGSPSLQFLQFSGAHFKEDDCYALATVQRTDLNVEFLQCKLEPQGAQDIFIDWFQKNQIVTKLEDCCVESSFLSALSGNNSVKRLSFIQKGEFVEEHMRSLARALPGNRGIEDLALKYFFGETASLLFPSIAMHPRIKCLHISSYYYLPCIAAKLKTTMLNAILQMLHLNTVLHTIYLPPTFTDEEVYQNSILPRLEMNRSCFEVQRQAMKRADPSIRPQLLGRALHKVRYNPNLFFRFLLENVPAFVRTDEEEEDVSVAPLEHDPIIVSGQKRKAQS
jgi:hypothetical protein